MFAGVVKFWKSLGSAVMFLEMHWRVALLYVQPQFPVDAWYSQTAFLKQAKVLFHRHEVLILPLATLPQISPEQPVGLHWKVVVWLTLETVVVFIRVMVVTFLQLHDSLVELAEQTGLAVFQTVLLTQQSQVDLFPKLMQLHVELVTSKVWI